MLLLEAEKINRYFIAGTRQNQALNTVSLTVCAGEFLVVTGPSGAGKSTLLNILSGLDRPSHGEVLFKGRTLALMAEKEIALLRNRSFGFIFQTPHLLMDKTVLENVALPFHYGVAFSRADVEGRCRTLLEYVDLAAMESRYPNTLSGGEMQRVVFARALCREPDVIFADEPTGSLDAENSQKILTLLQEQTARGRAVIMVTHDRETISFATRVVQLDKLTSVVEPIENACSPTAF